METIQIFEEQKPPVKEELKQTFIDLVLCATYDDIQAAAIAGSNDYHVRVLPLHSEYDANGYDGISTISMIGIEDIMYQLNSVGRRTFDVITAMVDSDDANIKMSPTELGTILANSPLFNATFVNIFKSTSPHKDKCGSPIERDYKSRPYLIILDASEVMCLDDNVVSLFNDFAKDVLNAYAYAIDHTVCIAAVKRKGYYKNNIRVLDWVEDKLVEPDGLISISKDATLKLDFNIRLDSLMSDLYNGQILMRDEMGLYVNDEKLDEFNRPTIIKYIKTALDDIIQFSKDADAFGVITPEIKEMITEVNNSLSERDFNNFDVTDILPIFDEIMASRGEVADKLLIASVEKFIEDRKEFLLTGKVKTNHKLIELGITEGINEEVVIPEECISTDCIDSDSYVNDFVDAINQLHKS